MLTGVSDEDMFDNADEDKDLVSQVRKNAPASTDASRTDREGTPGPQTNSQAGPQGSTESAAPGITESPGNISTSPSAAADPSAGATAGGNPSQS